MGVYKSKTSAIFWLFHDLFDKAEILNFRLCTLKLWLRLKPINIVPIAENRIYKLKLGPAGNKKSLSF
jgi:hypothetical protein